MEVYAGIDLHASNSYLAVVDREGKKIFKRRLLNDLSILSHVLEPYKQDMQGIAVESTFNWYWLVDALMEAGYSVHLANPVAIQKYKGMRHSDDSSDALWLKCCAWTFCRKDISIRDKSVRSGICCASACIWSS